MDEHVSLIGWPFGGYTILYKTTLNGVIKELKCNHWLCGNQFRLYDSNS